MTLAASTALTSACNDSPENPNAPASDESENPNDDNGDDGVVAERDAATRMDASARDGGPASQDRSRSDATVTADAASPGRIDGGSSNEAKCGGKLLDAPLDPGARGLWEVGVRTVKVGRLTVEVLYPAAPGSTTGKPEATYDIRNFLPEAERKKVPDSHVPAVGPIGGRLYRDVPLDEEHGPYNPVVFIHGTASFRIASGTTNVQWASRGFVVLAADYPGLGLHDQVASTLECGLPTTGSQDIPGDVNLQLAALKSGSGDLAFLKGKVDMEHIAIGGHSQGACVSATLSNVPGVRLVMPFSGSYPVDASPTLESVLFVGGMNDTVIGYDFPRIGNVVCPLFSSTTQIAYASSPGPTQVKKRLVGITGGGHLVPTDLCQKNDQGKNAVEEASADGVCGIGSAVIIGLPALFDCGAPGFDWQVGVKALNYATTAALEETLHCRDQSQQFANMQKAQPVIGQYMEELK